jgi:prepilin-type N-terminal cleavage/methylation domain-containing protein
MGRSPKGFTLIEMLIVIAIVGILAAVAWPFLQNQIVKARLTEVTNGMSNVASAVAAYYQDASNGGAGTFPACANKAEIQDSLGVSLGALTRINTISIDGTGVITVNLLGVSPLVDGENLTLTATVANDSSITWIWGASAGFPTNLMPKR